MASYGSLLAAFITALTEKMEVDTYDAYRVTVHFKNILFVTWLVPYFIAFADMVSNTTRAVLL